MEFSVKRHIIKSEWSIAFIEGSRSYKNSILPFAKVHCAHPYMDNFEVLLVGLRSLEFQVYKLPHSV